MEETSPFAKRGGSRVTLTDPRYSCILCGVCYRRTSSCSKPYTPQFGRERRFMNASNSTKQKSKKSRSAIDNLGLHNRHSNGWTTAFSSLYRIVEEEIVQPQPRPTCAGGVTKYDLGLPDGYVESLQRDKHIH
jgi:hypothetical protein